MRQCCCVPWRQLCHAFRTDVAALQGFGRGRNTHLSVFFKESQTLEEDVHFHFVLGVTSSTQDAFVKPMLNCVLSRRRREYTGRQAFMPLKTIREGGFIEPDGSLLIMLEIVELPTNGDAHAHSRAASPAKRAGSGGDVAAAANDADHVAGDRDGGGSGNAVQQQQQQQDVAAAQAADGVAGMRVK